jgi:hypothetical protein
MPRKVRQVRADLRKAGFGRRPGKGSHEVGSIRLFRAGTSPSLDTMATMPSRIKRRKRDAIADVRKRQGTP